MINVNIRHYIYHVVLFKMDGMRERHELDRLIKKKIAVMV